MDEARAEGTTVGHDAIAARAYELYVAQGCCDGLELEHWLEAESQLRAVPPHRS